MRSVPGSSVRFGKQPKEVLVKRMTVYWKLRVLGAIDSMAGNSIKSRIREVRKLAFHDAEGMPHVFTWRTIPTWLSIYRQHDVQALVTRPRAVRANPASSPVSSWPCFNLPRSRRFR